MTTAMAIPQKKSIHRALTFDALVEQIRETLAAGRARAEEAVDRERARTYWEAGRFIHVYLLKGEDRAKYGEKIIPDLAKEIGFSARHVQQMVTVYRAFPIWNTCSKLAWSELELLVRLENPGERLTLARRAVLRKWSTREVEAAVRKIQQKKLSSPSKGKRAGAQKGDRQTKLVPRKGLFFTYPIVRPQSMHPEEKEHSLDLGFKNRISLELPGIQNPQKGDFIEALRVKKSATGDQYKFRKTKGRAHWYTYKAKARTFYDADTFWVDVDLGFRVWTEQKLRLRGIDAEELGAGGEKAAAYVKKTLSEVPFIVITVSGRDKFGRPLADVFYLPGAGDREKVLTEGRFLNQELLDLGFAVHAKD